MYSWADEAGIVGLVSKLVGLRGKKTSKIMFPGVEKNNCSSILLVNCLETCWLTVYWQMKWLISCLKIHTFCKHCPCSLMTFAFWSCSFFSLYFSKNLKQYPIKLRKKHSQLCKKSSIQIHDYAYFFLSHT